MPHLTARPAGLLLTCLSLLLAGCTTTKTLDETRTTAEASVATLERFMKDPEMTWLHQNLPKAKAVLISPRIWQAGLIVGGSGGKGVAYARTAAAPGWTSPAFYTLATGSIGLQAGAEAAEMVTLVMTDKGLNSLVSTSFKLGADVSVAAGPVGAGTGAPVTADMVVYARAKGLYAGLNLTGTVINVDEKANQAFYGRPANPADILLTGRVTNALGEQMAQNIARVAGAGTR